jgi:hypothetical protein
MKPNTRLLIRFTFSDGSMKSWGYDYPYFNSALGVKTAITEDFKKLPENTEIHLFYFSHDTTITANTPLELANKAAEWIVATGDFNGN